MCLCVPTVTLIVMPARKYTDSDVAVVLALAGPPQCLGTPAIVKVYPKYDKRWVQRVLAKHRGQQAQSSSQAVPTPPRKPPGRRPKTTAQQDRRPVRYAPAQCAYRPP
jgi:hypothetical protein